NRLLDVVERIERGRHIPKMDEPRRLSSALIEFLQEQFEVLPGRRRDYEFSLTTRGELIAGGHGYHFATSGLEFLCETLAHAALVDKQHPCGVFFIRSD